MALSDRGQALAPIPLARPAEVAAAGRLGDLLRAAEVREADLPALAGRPARDGLRVVYLSAPVELGGEERLLLDQASRLSAAGAEVTVLWRGRAPERPDDELRVVEVPFGGAFCDALPPCDLVVAGCWDLVLPARQLGVAPVALLEQGDLAALGDVPENLAALIRRALRAAAVVWCDDPGRRRQIRDRYAVAAEEEPGAGVRAACEAVVERFPPVARTGDGKLLVEDLPLSRLALARLRTRLSTCATSELLVPVAQPALGPHWIVRWRVVGWTPGAPPGSTRLWAPLRSTVPVRDASHQGALDQLRAGRHERAYRRYAAACEAGSQAEQAVAGRWLVVSLLAAGRPGAAAELAGAFARDFPTHPDYLYLVTAAALAAGRPVDVAGPLEAIRLLGEGSQYDEWFEDPYGLLVDALRRRAPAAPPGPQRSSRR